MGVADVHARNENGETPLDLAVVYGHVGLAEELRGIRGSSVGAGNKSGKM